MRIYLLHYSSPPIVGGVESVLAHHARLMANAGHEVTILAGRGEQFDERIKVRILPRLDSRHEEVMEVKGLLDKGKYTPSFDALRDEIKKELLEKLKGCDILIAHNVASLSKNLALTAVLNEGSQTPNFPKLVLWHHDLAWTTPRYRDELHDGYPWDLLRKPRADINYITISKFRQQELAGLFNCPTERLEVIYNGVDPHELLGLSQPGLALIERLNLREAGLILLMPVRVTQAKNIELAIRLAAALKERDIHSKIILTGPPDPHDQNNMTYFQSLLALRQKLQVEKEMCFVYESGPDANQPNMVDMQIVGDLFRVSDALFMPSHREGFGMPILEAGLVGLPVFCTAIPAAEELGGKDVTIFSAELDPHDVAELIMNRMENNSSWRLRRRVRQSLTWQSIFQQSILPLLEKGAS